MAFWPSYVDSRIITDITKQMQGIDRVVKLADGSYQRIEEKYDATRFNNVFLEYRVDGKPGYMEKDQETDWLCYAYKRPERSWMLHFPTLQHIWKRYKRHWIDIYKEREIPNYQYRAYGVPVPVSEIQKVMPADAMVYYPGRAEAEAEYEAERQLTKKRLYERLKRQG